jgi:hypothetical protein
VSIIANPQFIKFSNGVARMTYNRVVTPNALAKVIIFPAMQFEIG